MSEYVKPSRAEEQAAYGDELGRDITPDNAIVVIARELRFIRHALGDMAHGDEPGMTVGEQIQSVLWDSLGAHEEDTSIPALLKRIADALENR